MAELYWWEATRWNGEVLMLTPDEGKEAAVQHMLGGVLSVKRLRSTLSMKDFKSVEPSERMYGEEAKMIEGGESADTPKYLPIVTERGVLCRWVKKRMPYMAWKRDHSGFRILHSDDESGQLWVVRTQTLTEGTRNATRFTNGWEILEGWEEDLMTRNTVAR